MWKVVDAAERAAADRKMFDTKPNIGELLKRFQTGDYDVLLVSDDKER